MSIKTEIQNYPGIFTKSNGINPALTRQNSKFVKTKIYADIMQLSIGDTLAEKIYCIINDIIETQRCKSCDNTVTFKNFKTGYRPYCSQTCKANDPDYQDLKQKTTLKLYGVASYSQTDEYKEKCKRTNLSRHGVENYAQSKEFLLKSDKTKLNKYGNKRYVNPAKTKQTCLARYGVSNVSQQHIPPGSLSKLNDEEWLSNEYCHLEKSAESIADELNVNALLVKKHLRKFKISNKFNARSDYERVLVEYITKKYRLKMDVGNRSVIAPHEIDIYIKEHNLAIEFNGRHWHKPQRYGSINNWYEYHNMKIDKCASAGIRLLHLWEDHGDHLKLIDDAINGVIHNDLSCVLTSVKWTK
jgi:hypothetical protein